MLPVPTLRLELRVRRSPNGISSYPGTTAHHITKFVTAAAGKLGHSQWSPVGSKKKRHIAYRFESSLKECIHEPKQEFTNLHVGTHVVPACILLLAASWPHAIPRLLGSPPFISTPFDLLSFKR
jgi:hypothetical protein